MASIIAAVAENRVIGSNGDMPWGRSLKSDLKRFKELTTGNAVIIGRKTFFSLGKPLPNRLNVVVSKNRDLVLPSEVVHASSLQDAIHKCTGYKAFIIGGGEIFSMAFEWSTLIYLTVVHHEFPGDVVFPPISNKSWHLESEEFNDRDEKNAYATTFQIWRKK